VMKIKRSHLIKSHYYLRAEAPDYFVFNRKHKCLLHRLAEKILWQLKCIRSNLRQSNCPGS
jgi:hypothetical protein